jgi:putative oxygen-independent coproporphyrinogen III oxidase
MSLGIYIHIPFCQTRCSYCHFVTRPWRDGIAERYSDAVVREIEMHFATHPCREQVDTIYFGGGTPSIVPAEHIEAMLHICRNCFPIAPDAEISLEANPETITDEKIKAYRRLGVNRISLGAQSFDEEGLRRVGRTHSADDVERSLELLRSNGVDNLNLDLMLGLPAQTERTWREDLDHMFMLAPPHVSVYMLDLDEKTPLYHSLKKIPQPMPEDDQISDWYLESIEHFAAHGYDQYEISNFAQPGMRSRHNLKYWQREPVLGFGVASHSYDGSSRYANHSNMNAYLQFVEKGESPVEWYQPLGRRQALEETLFLGLRLLQGVDWNRMKHEYEESELSGYEASLREMSSRGLIDWDDATVRLTPQGILLSNEVFQTFV